MKLVCFPNNAAGGLICNLLNDRTIRMVGYKTNDPAHSVFKIGDEPGIQYTVDPVVWEHRVQLYRNKDMWFGTHCHPVGVPDLRKFDNVLAITTVSRTSKLYRWLRLYYGWFKPNNPTWQETNSIDSYDQIRELAKSCYGEFAPHTDCDNVDFEHIVNGDFVADRNLNVDQFELWKQSNSFLYSNNADWAIERFNEAEYEILKNDAWKYY